MAFVAIAAGCTTPPSERDGNGPLVGPTASPTGQGASVLRLSTEEPDSLDPAQIDGSHELLLADQIFDGLVEYDPETLRVVPALARDWEAREGGEVIEFRLRRDARFHDGTPVTAEDFVSAWSRLADPLASAPYGFLLERVAGYDEFQTRPLSELEGLQAAGARTLRVRLRSPWPDFVALLGHPALAPVPASAPDETLGRTPVGTGPYRLLSSLSPGSTVVMERFSRFYGAAPGIDRLEFHVVADPTDAWPDFLAGDLDMATIPPSALADAQSRYGSGGITPLARVLYCGFNQTEERFRDGGLRTAVSLALDRASLASTIYAGVAVAATGLVPPTIPGADDDACGRRCRRNVDEASRVAGELPRGSRTFALDYTDSQLGDALARTIAEQLGEAGLRVEPRAHSEAEYTRLLLEERHEFFCLVWMADYPRQQALLEPLFLPDSEDNHAGVDDSVLSDLLRRAREERSAEKRERLYAEVERRALARMYLVPLVWFRSHMAVQPYVEGFAVDPLGLFDASALTVER